MASVNYSGRIQQIEIRTQATNKTTAQLLYVHRAGETIKQRTTTSISDASTLSTQLRHLMSHKKIYNFALRTRVTPIFYSFFSPPSADCHTTDLARDYSWGDAPNETYMTRPTMLKTHVDSMLKPRLHQRRYLYLRIVTFTPLFKEETPVFSH